MRYTYPASKSPIQEYSSDSGSGSSPAKEETCKFRIGAGFNQPPYEAASQQGLVFKMHRLAELLSMGGSAALKYSVI